MLFTQKSEVDIHEMSPLALAFVGDAVLELLVRARLVGTTRLQPNRLHTVATHYVSAHAQNLELDIIKPMLNIGNGSNCSCIWIIILLLLCGGCGGGGFCGGNGCGCDNDCIWIILILLFCCGNNNGGGCGCGC